MARYLLFHAVGVNIFFFDLSTYMLQDALESSDIDQGVVDRTMYSTHPILSFFMTLSDAALARAAYCHAKYLNAEIMGFGIELQWRIAVYRMGERNAAKEYLETLLILIHTVTVASLFFTPLDFHLN